MSATQIAILGAIAGSTIFLGLPIGRLPNPAPKLRALLNAIATGILLFILWDVLAHAWEPIDSALSDHPSSAQASSAQASSAVGNGLVLAVGLIVGLLGLVYFDRWIARRAGRDTSAGGGNVASTGNSGTKNTSSVGGGIDIGSGGAGGVAIAASVETRRSMAWHLALMIAVGIGLHNFAEGLAIGSSAAAGQLSLAILLVIGFGLHNATEGFGIVAPLAAAGQRPTWGYLGVLGLIGGGPTLIGTLVGQRFTNTTVSIAFLALAAGSILYVVIELLAVARRFNFKEITTWGIAAGLIAGFLTDAIVTAAGA